MRGSLVRPDSDGAALSAPSHLLRLVHNPYPPTIPRPSNSTPSSDTHRSFGPRTQSSITLVLWGILLRNAKVSFFGVHHPFCHRDSDVYDPGGALTPPSATCRCAGRRLGDGTSHYLAYGSYSHCLTLLPVHAPYRWLGPYRPWGPPHPWNRRRRHYPDPMLIYTNIPSRPTPQPTTTNILSITGTTRFNG